MKSPGGHCKREDRTGDKGLAQKLNGIAPD